MPRSFSDIALAPTLVLYRLATRHLFTSSIVYLRSAFILDLPTSSNTHTAQCAAGLSKTLARSPPSSQQLRATHTTSSANRNNAMASRGATTPHRHTVVPIDLTMRRYALRPHPSLTNTPESDHKSACKVSRPAAISNAQSYHRVLPLQALVPQRKPTNTADQGADPRQYSSKKTAQQQEPQPA